MQQQKTSEYRHGEMQNDKKFEMMDDKVMSDCTGYDVVKTGQKSIASFLLLCFAPSPTKYVYAAKHGQRVDFQ